LWEQKTDVGSKTDIREENKLGATGTIGKNERKII
jgi:hypothetical protein